MITWLVAVFLTSLAVDGPPRIEAGTGDWGNIPLLSNRGFHHITSNQVEMLHEAFESAECAAGQPHRKRLNLEVPFLVQFDEIGTLQRIVVRDLGCRRAEGVIAGAVMRLIELGENRATGENGTGWYRGAIRFRSS